MGTATVLKSRIHHLEEQTRERSSGWVRSSPMGDVGSSLAVASMVRTVSGCGRAWCLVHFMAASLTKYGRKRGVPGGQSRCTTAGELMGANLWIDLVGL